jgi:hypothetical protein
MDVAVGETDSCVGLPVIVCGAKYYRLLPFHSSTSCDVH